MVANMQRLEMTARFFIQRLELSGISEQRRQPVSKIDYQALREAAEKATTGNWWIDSHGQAMVSFIDNEVLEVFVTDNKRDAVRHEDTGNLSRWRNDNDATFIATANPATVLALLDERERNQQYIKCRDQENEDIALTVGKLRVELEAAEKRNAKLQSENAYIRNRFKELDLLIGKNILVMHAAIIEWQATGDAKSGLAWIYNTLFGPGELPDESEKDAQAYFNRKYAPIDEKLMELHKWFWEQSESERAAGIRIKGE
ncbi:TPA: ead/Ea22-like family protein [Escherichia coli]